MLSFLFQTMVSPGCNNAQCLCKMPCKPKSHNQTCKRLMPNQLIQSWKNVKMYLFNQHETVQLQYTNQFNHVFKCTWIDSIKSKERPKWFNKSDQPSINQLNIYVDILLKTYFFNLFWENVRFRWSFWGYFESIQLIQSCQSLKANRLSLLLCENELTQSPINSLAKGTE